MPRICYSFCWLLLLTCNLSRAAQPKAESEALLTSKRWLIIACGLPGDEEHRVRLTETCRTLISRCDDLGVAQSNLVVLAGDQRMQQELPTFDGTHEVCNSVRLKNAITKVSQASSSDDSCWIMLLGHGHLYDRESKFNVEGKDVDQHEFALWLDELPHREQVVWVTTPVSGFWIRPLSKPDRVVITATEADLEYTGTEMPYSLAATIANENGELRDIDNDGDLTLFDLYICTALHVAAQFALSESLQTEHSQLDDNGDQRGKELQARFLELAADPVVMPTGDASPTAEDLAQNKAPFRVPPATDGYRSQLIKLRP